MCGPGPILARDVRYLAASLTEGLPYGYYIADSCMFACVVMCADADILCLHIKLYI